MLAVQEIASSRAHGMDDVVESAPRPMWHQPVMLREVLDLLEPHDGKVIVDGTVGTGGHSVAVVSRLLPSGRLIALDRDTRALDTARARLLEFEPNITWIQGNFRDLSSLLATAGIRRLDGVLLDLGMSSPQVDQPERGFSFSKPGPLDMRMDPTQPLTAATIVNEWTAAALADVLATLGEERYARRIAQRIVETRRAQLIDSTTALAEIIARAVPSTARYGRLHPATRTFQALRMAVNDELGALEAVLEVLPDLLAPGARAVIIAFHSLEDRRVKQAFAQGARDDQWDILTKKPLRASEEEVAQNPRARSAKLRAVVRR